MNPYVKAVKALPDYQLALLFENGEERIFDVKPYLQQGVFAQLENLARFRAVRAIAGSVEWPGELDLSYDTLYVESQPASAKPEIAGAAS
jgi:hypothetical protein